MQRARRARERRAARTARGPANPWLAAAAASRGPAARAEPEDRESAQTASRALADHGPAVWWLGVHGGAGESSLERLVPGTRAAGHAWPEPSGDARPRVVLVARTHAAGLIGAHNAATRWAQADPRTTQLLGIALIADAPGRLPRPLRPLRAGLDGVAPLIWDLPWCEPLRLGAALSVAGAPRAMRDLADDVHALAEAEGWRPESAASSALISPATPPSP